VYFFCTYFDRNFLARGLALYNSLREHCPDFRLWVLCLDAETYTILSQRNPKNMHLITLEEFERGDTELLQAKQNRSVVEYYFTCTPSLPLFILNHYPDVGLITYLDADLFFFADPVQLFAEMDGKSIAIIGHRFPERLSYKERNGIYNVGWLSFRRDENGLKCLDWWRALCLEWCYDRIEDDRFADQKYLDRFPDRFGEEIVLHHKGANVAPWNVERYALSMRGDCVYIDDEPLIFYHFHGLKKIFQFVYDFGFQPYGLRKSQDLINHIYIPYIRTLQIQLPGKPILQKTRDWPLQKGMIARLKESKRWWLMFLKGIGRRQFSIIVNGKVIMS
jgi:hypothetical protein